MRFAVPLSVLLAAVSSTLAALTARQSLPSCAVPCMENADTGSCAPVDDSCLCKNQQFINSTASCIASSCTGSDLQNADAYAQQLCLAVGVTLTESSATSTSTSTVLDCFIHRFIHERGVHD
ncbi:hypothetical protein JVU11DRAFT_9795 [Chiua virens]|nr:hypothetical protein JVU11DRAFT_9795 [Chiua virens]